MQKVFEVLEQIGRNSSRNVKKDILRANQDNELLKKFFLYAFNDRWIYGIGTKSINKFGNQLIPSQSKKLETGQKVLSFFGNPVGPDLNYRSPIIGLRIFDLLDELIKHPYGSNEDISAVNNFLSLCNETEYYWYRRLILKDLKIGCTITTVNEIYDDYIPHFEVMLAHSYKDHKDKITEKTLFQIQKKENGFRFVTYLYPDGQTEFFTRNGVQLFDFPEIEEMFSKMVDRNKAIMVYDGEAEVGGTFNETQKYMMRSGPKTGVVYHIFECQTFAEFDNGGSLIGLFDRYDLAKQLVPSGLTWIKVVPELYRGTDLAWATDWFNYAKTQGWEGIMLKLNVPYVRKRTWAMLKLKEILEIDLICIRVNRGDLDGAYADTLGSITVDFNGVEVNVGGGYNLSEREEYWTHPDRIVGKTVTLTYLSETTNERNQPSLQSAQFVGVRFDK